MNELDKEALDRHITKEPPYEKSCEDCGCYEKEQTKECYRNDSCPCHGVYTWAQEGDECPDCSTELKRVNNKFVCDCSPNEEVARDLGKMGKKLRSLADEINRLIVRIE